MRADLPAALSRLGADLDAVRVDLVVPGADAVPWDFLRAARARRGEKCRP
jgi:hypothetical protein